MAGYGQRYGTAAVSLRARDQSLPGKSFPLLAKRYATVVDGQWRIRDIELFQSEQRAANLPVTRFGVCPLPRADVGEPHAGWINGNFFIIPAGSHNQQGAWAFMKFWSGLEGNAAEAAITCVRGGWIPVTQEVVDQPLFQDHLHQQPMWVTFVGLAAEATQRPRPNVRSALRLDREVRAVAERAMYGGLSVSVPTLLREASERLNDQAH
jgi:multiple sugar transport system substrate-binding protein